ncbi:MAG: hypothetical protein JW885_09785, partial [Deltaproteobacteria bacterium]|nr:hypothetical protein [Candidatus Zymogenaceae bacterium]
MDVLQFLRKIEELYDVGGEENPVDIIYEFKMDSIKEKLPKDTEEIKAKRERYARKWKGRKGSGRGLRNDVETCRYNKRKSLIYTLIAVVTSCVDSLPSCKTVLLYYATLSSATV